MIELSRAYDMLPVNVVLPEDQEQMALTLNGKKQNIRKKDFIVFAQKCEISKNAAERMLASVCKQKEKMLAECDQSYLPEEYKVKIKELISTRIEIF